MSIFTRFKKWLPQRKPPEYKNNIPKEKETIRKMFGIYCHANHGTEGDKLCPKCNGLLATVFTKMNRCQYGITKPICDRCEKPCFGANATAEFRKIMSENHGKMFFKHPMIAVRHKLASIGFDYMKMQQERKAEDKAKAKSKKKEDKK